MFVQFAMLRRIGGETVAETVREIMNRLFTNYTMSFLNLDGRSCGKLPFRHSPLCKVLVGQYNSVVYVGLVFLSVIGEWALNYCMLNEHGV